jgi:hypothetical protein
MEKQNRNHLVIASPHNLADQSANWWITGLLNSGKFFEKTNLCRAEFEFES